MYLYRTPLLEPSFPLIRLHCPPDFTASTWNIYMTHVFICITTYVSIWWVTFIYVASERVGAEEGMRVTWLPLSTLQRTQVSISFPRDCLDDSVLLFFL